MSQGSWARFLVAMTSVWAFRQAFEDTAEFPIAGRVVGVDVLVDEV
jgi:hypothetical protein